MNFSKQRKRPGLMFTIWLTALGVVSSPALLSMTRPAFSLSEIQREELPAPTTPPATNDTTTPPGTTVPVPDAPGTTPPAANEPANEGLPAEPGDDQPAVPDDGSQPASPEEGAPEGPAQDGGISSPHVDPDAPLPEVIYDLGKLPEPVRRMHDLIVEACKSGDIEKLRPLIGIGDDQTQLSLTDIDGDAIAFLKGLSGDSEGQEILAIMEEVLGAGYVHLDAGTPEELYVWPYFFALPLDKLDPKQRVELFKIVTAGDYEDMKTFGAYIFYRVGITPEGHWAFFVAGD